MSAAAWSKSRSIELRPTKTRLPLPRGWIASSRPGQIIRRTVSVLQPSSLATSPTENAIGAVRAIAWDRWPVSHVCTTKSHRPARTRARGPPFSPVPPAARRPSSPAAAHEVVEPH
jgi:hypothetical protein